MQGTPIQGAPYNSIVIEKYGAISVRIVWDWDGVSSSPYHGDVVSVSVQNFSDSLCTVSLPNKGSGDKFLTLDPGYSNVFTGGALNSQGLKDIFNLYDMVVQA